MSENKKDHKGNRNSRGGNRRRHHNKRKGGGRFQKKPLSGDRIITKYDNLLDQHLQARRKYYEMFHRSTGQALRKLKKNFDDSLINLRQFEEKLDEKQLETLKTKIEGYKLDTDYSDAHGSETDPIPEGPFENPHLNQKQLDREDFSGDNEDSVGTMDDYQRYKDSLI
jgi:hypothetical protein